MKTAKKRPLVYQSSHIYAESAGYTKSASTSTSASAEYRKPPAGTVDKLTEVSVVMFYGNFSCWFERHLRPIRSKVTFKPTKSVVKRHSLACRSVCSAQLSSMNVQSCRKFIKFSQRSTPAEAYQTLLFGRSNGSIHVEERGPADFSPET